MHHNSGLVSRMRFELAVLAQKVICFLRLLEMEDAQQLCAPEQSENNSQSSLQKCISVLKAARNDNERFAALLLVTQLVHSNSVDSSGRRQLFDAVGFNFINRLLSTRNVPNECPQDVYRSLAITILACFATDEEFLVHSEMISKIPLFLAGISNEEENKAILDDSYEILSSLASTSVGCSHLARKEAFSTLCRIASGCSQNKSKKAVEIMAQIINNSPCAIWEEQREILFDALNALSERFKEAQDSTKFELCNSLVLLLAGAEKVVFQRDEGSRWLEAIHTGLNQILQSKVSPQQRDPAILLVSLVIDLVGMDWMLQSTGQESPGLFILSTTIASIETRMILDGKTLIEIFPKAAVLISCYNILEKAINFAVVNTGSSRSSSDGDFWKLTNSSLPKVYSQATEAIHSIIQFLQSVACFQDKETLDGRSGQLVYASVRVLCAWMAEETAALQDSICKLLPFLLKLGKESLDTSSCTYEEHSPNARTNETKEPSPRTADYVSSVDFKDMIRERLLNKVDIMRFLLPPLCHLSADDKTRKILIDNGGLELLSRYFFRQWKIWNEQADNDSDVHEAETCLVTMLGILLNFVVTEATLAINNHAFQELCQHAIASAPSLLSLERNVVMLVHLVVFGLLFLRSCMEHNKAISCEDLSKFLKCSIYILKEAKPLLHKDGNHEFFKHDKPHLATRCKEAWTDIGELWFLGLQVVSVLARSLPMMRDVLKESGWAEVIATDLNSDSQDQELTGDEREALLDFVRKLNDL